MEFFASLHFSNSYQFETCTAYPYTAGHFELIEVPFRGSGGIRASRPASGCATDGAPWFKRSRKAQHRKFRTGSNTKVFETWRKANTTLFAFRLRKIQGWGFFQSFLSVEIADSNVGDRCFPHGFIQIPWNQSSSRALARSGSLSMCARDGRVVLARANSRRSRHRSWSPRRL